MLIFVMITRLFDQKHVRGRQARTMSLERYLLLESLKQIVNLQKAFIGGMIHPGVPNLHPHQAAKDAGNYRRLLSNNLDAEAVHR